MRTLSGDETRKLLISVETVKHQLRDNPAFAVIQCVPDSTLAGFVSGVASVSTHLGGPVQMAIEPLPLAVAQRLREYVHRFSQLPLEEQQAELDAQIARLRDKDAERSVR